MPRKRLGRPAVTTLPFDLGALQVFLMVCDKGGMGAAARALGVTQPGVSQAISDLETALGKKLFERSVRPLALTAAGTLLRERAILLVAEAHEVSAALRESERGHLFRIRVGLAGSVMRALAEKLSKFLSTQAAEVVILSGFTSSHAEGIISRSADISISWGDMEDADWVERHLILEEPYFMLFPSSFPESREGLTALANRLPLIRHSARSQTGRDVDRHLRRVRIEIPRYQEFDSPIGVTAAVAAGTGWAITTPLSAFEGGLTPLIRAVKLPEPGLGRRLYLLARKNELGRLPRALANEARHILNGTVLPQIAKHTPWVKDLIRIPPESSR